MSWTNYHGHCHYCDGKGEPESYVKWAIEAKMPALGFSSHAPVPFESFWNMPHERLNSYLGEIDRLKLKYADKITIHKSLEVDYVEGLMGPRTEFTNSLNLDYVIGSVHFLGQRENGEYWAIDGSFDSFTIGLREIFGDDIKKAVHEFYYQQKQMVIHQTPDIIGHLDKIKMHNKHQPLFDETASWYKDEVRAMLENISRTNCIVEINTKSYSRNGLLFPGEEYFEWLKELKIPVVINSDAHFPEHLLDGFKEVAGMLKYHGIDEVIVLQNGKWNSCGFDENGLLS
jgi:histidinol-phosphatase (PHP family)